MTVVSARKNRHVSPNDRLVKYARVHEHGAVTTSYCRSLASREWLELPLNDLRRLPVLTAIVRKRARAAEPKSTGECADDTVTQFDRLVLVRVELVAVVMISREPKAATAFHSPQPSNNSSLWSKPFEKRVRHSY